MTAPTRRWIHAPPKTHQLPTKRLRPPRSVSARRLRRTLSPRLLFCALNAAAVHLGRCVSPLLNLILPPLSAQVLGKSADEAKPTAPSATAANKSLKVRGTQPPDDL